MRRWARGLPVILIGILAATAMTNTETATAPAGAAVLARAPSPIVATSSSGDLEARLIGDDAIVVDPGAAIRRSFVVTNHSSSIRLTVRLSTVDAVARSDGRVRYANDASPTGPASWLTLSDVIATIEPGASVHGSFTISPPADADPGDVVAGLVAQIDHAVRVSDNGEVKSRDSISLPVAIKVKGSATALVSIGRVTAVKDGGREYLEIMFQNSGATANTMVGQVSVLGAHPRSESVTAVVAPLTHTNARVPFAMPDGAKTVQVSVETQDAGGDQASWSGAVGSATAASASAAPAASRSVPRPAASTLVPHDSSIPWAAPILVFVALLAAAIWLVAEVRRSRRRRVAMILASAQSGVLAPAAPTMYAPDPVWSEHVGALTSKLDTVVDAIDRLVARLGDTPSPAPIPAPSSESVPAPVPVPVAVVPPQPDPAFDEPRPSAASAARSPAETGALLFAPAATSSAPPDESAGDEQYPYDWPSQEQLDQFEARQRASQQDSS